MNAHGRRRPSRATWIPVALLPVLAVLAVLRLLSGDHAPRESTSSRAHASAHVRGVADEATEPRFEPARVLLPPDWRRTRGEAGVTTWLSPDGDDSVSVAAVESTATSLPAIVADVARAARAADPGARVGAPRALAAPPHAHRDVLLDLALQTTVGERPVYVRQIWRRDARAGHDIVATWTSGDDSWSIDPTTTVPTLALR